MAADAAAANHAANGNAAESTIERLDDHAAGDLADHLESLLARLQALPEQPARAIALDVIQAIVQLYGEGLARVVERVSEDEPELMRRLLHDDLISHLLVLHDLHPDSLDDRVHHAIDVLHVELESRGTHVELVALAGDVARVRVTRGGRGGASSSHAVRRTIQDAVLRVAPELSRVDVEDATESAPALVTLAGPRRSRKAQGGGDAEPSAVHDTPPSTP